MVKNSGKKMNITLKIRDKQIEDNPKEHWKISTKVTAAGGIMMSGFKPNKIKER